MALLRLLIIFISVILTIFSHISAIDDPSFTSTFTSSSSGTSYSAAPSPTFSTCSAPISPFSLSSSSEALKSAAISPFSLSSSSEALKSPPFLNPLASITQTLAELGFHDFALASHSLALSNAPHISWLGPITVFAPADASVRTCPSWSLTLLLQEHTVPGFHPLDHNRLITFGTEIETVLAGKCLRVTSAVNANKSFVGGAKITRPNLYVGDHFIIHGIQGIVSPHACSVRGRRRLLSLSLSSPSPSPLEEKKEKHHLLNYIGVVTTVFYYASPAFNPTVWMAWSRADEFYNYSFLTSVTGIFATFTGAAVSFLSKKIESMIAEIVGLCAFSVYSFFHLRSGKKKHRVLYAVCFSILLVLSIAVAVICFFHEPKERVSIVGTHAMICDFLLFLSPLRDLSADEFDKYSLITPLFGFVDSVTWLLLSTLVERDVIMMVNSVLGMVAFLLEIGLVGFAYYFPTHPQAAA